MRDPSCLPKPRVLFPCSDASASPFSSPVCLHSHWGPWCQLPSSQDDSQIPHTSPDLPISTLACRTPPCGEPTDLQLPLVKSQNHCLPLPNMVILLCPSTDIFILILPVKDIRLSLAHALLLDIPVPLSVFPIFPRTPFLDNLKWVGSFPPHSTDLYTNS